MDKHKNKTNERETENNRKDFFCLNNNLTFVPTENIRSIERIIDDWSAVKKIIKR
jgi:hypothetical protein